jgi:hypothetical protein
LLRTLDKWLQGSGDVNNTGDGTLDNLEFVSSSSSFSSPAPSPIPGISPEEYQLVLRFLKGEERDISKVPERVRQIAADFYQSRSATVRNINNARAFNLARAQALRTGVNPPGNLAQFNASLRLLGITRIAAGCGVLTGVIALGALIDYGVHERDRMKLGIPPGSILLREKTNLNGWQQTWQTPDGRIIVKTVK